MEIEYYVNGERVKIIHEFEAGNGTFAVVDGGDGMTVERKSNLLKWEETYQHKNEKRIADRIAKLIADEQKIIKKMKNKAIKQLATRIRMNVAFGSDSGGVVALSIAQELEKMVDKIESTSDVFEDKP